MIFYLMNYLSFGSYSTNDGAKTKCDNCDKGQCVFLHAKIATLSTTTHNYIYYYIHIYNNN